MGPAAPGDSPSGRVAGPQERLRPRQGAGLGGGQSRTSSHQHQAKFALSLTSIARMPCCALSLVRLNTDVVHVSTWMSWCCFYRGPGGDLAGAGAHRVLLVTFLSSCCLSGVSQQRSRVKIALRITKMYKLETLLIF